MKRDLGRSIKGLEFKERLRNKWTAMRKRTPIIKRIAIFVYRPIASLKESASIKFKTVMEESVKRTKRVKDDFVNNHSITSTVAVMNDAENIKDVDDELIQNNPKIFVQAIKTLAKREYTVTNYSVTIDGNGNKIDEYGNPRRRCRWDIKLKQKRVVISKDKAKDFFDDKTSSDEVKQNIKAYLNGKVYADYATHDLGTVVERKSRQIYDVAEVTNFLEKYKCKCPSLFSKSGAESEISTNFAKNLFLLIYSKASTEYKDEEFEKLANVFDDETKKDLTVYKDSFFKERECVR